LVEQLAEQKPSLKTLKTLKDLVQKSGHGLRGFINGLRKRQGHPTVRVGEYLLGRPKFA